MIERNLGYTASLARTAAAPVYTGTLALFDAQGSPSGPDLADPWALIHEAELVVHPLDFDHERVVSAEGWAHIQPRLPHRPTDRLRELAARAVAIGVRPRSPRGPHRVHDQGVPRR